MNDNVVKNGSRQSRHSRGIISYSITLPAGLKHVDGYVVLLLLFLLPSQLQEHSESTSPLDVRRLIRLGGHHKFLSSDTYLRRQTLSQMRPRGVGDKGTKSAQE